MNSLEKIDAFDVNQANHMVKTMYLMQWYVCFFGLAWGAAFENYYILNQIQQEQYGSQYLQVKSKIKHKYFVKLVNSLKKIDLNETPSIEKYAKEHDYTKLLNMLDGLRGYFENREEYERCAVIKKYIDACLLSDGPLHTLELSDYDIQRLFNKL